MSPHFRHAVQNAGSYFSRMRSLSRTHGCASFTAKPSSGGASSARSVSGGYGALVETSPDAIVITGLDTRILLCNRQAAELHGYRDPGELVGKAFDLIAPEDRALARENARTTLETGGVRDIEYTLLRADGTRFPAELSASLISDPAGEPRAFLGVLRDITARKHAKQQLREAEAKYRTLVEQLPAVVYLCRFGGTGEWLYISPSFLEGSQQAICRRLVPPEPLRQILKTEWCFRVREAAQKIDRSGRSIDPVPLISQWDGSRLFRQLVNVHGRSPP